MTANDLHQLTELAETIEWETETPGEFLAECIDGKGWSRADFARATGLNPVYVSRLVNNKVPINEETSLLLAQAFGTTAELWLNTQRHYDLRRAYRANRNKLSPRDAVGQVKSSS